jgi:epoxyqueuosine reductase
MVMHSGPHTPATRIKALASEQGFLRCGFTTTGALDRERERFERWLSCGYHGDLTYLERNSDKRFNPSLLLEGAMTAIVLAYPYGNGPKALLNRSGIGLYGWGEDYHTLLPRQAAPVMALLETLDPMSHSRFYTDTAPLAERSLAVRAGLGWRGTNGTLIIPGMGSMVYLSVILTTIPLTTDTPYAGNGCCPCTLCRDGCPTGAIVSPGMLDVRRCLSYHTNSSREPIPDTVAEALSGQIFGCDICQEVCPLNHPPNLAAGTQPGAPFPRGYPTTPGGWETMDEETFKAVFAGSAPGQTGYSRMRYQAGIAMRHPRQEDSPQL